MLPARKTRADKKPYNPGSGRHAGQPAWPVIVPTKGQQQQRDCKPHVEYGGGCRPYCGAELGTDFGSGREALCANWLLLRQTALHMLPCAPVYQKMLKKWE